MLRPTSTLLPRTVPRYTTLFRTTCRTMSTFVEQQPGQSEDLARRNELAENIATVRNRMEATLQSEREARLVAVSKLKPVSDILYAYEAGQKHFGENYVQELIEKSQVLPQDINWHFIGSLQSNKCKVVAAIPNLYVVETIDSVKKADAMNKACTSRTAPLRVFVQVNTSGEESKSGVSPDDCVEVAAHIVNSCPQLQLAGLMTIGAPDRAATEEPNPDFVCLNECRKRVEEKLTLQGLELSMGMSDDFEEALKLGSTNIRVGSTIFGTRPPKPKH